MASRLKALFVLAAPFLLSALILVTLFFADGRLREVQSERSRQEWGRLARQGLHNLRASHTLESQFEIMGARFESLVYESSKRSRMGSLFDSEMSQAAFDKAFPPTHRPAGTLLFSFGVSPDGRFIPFPHKKLPRMKGRILAELMDFYQMTSEAGVVDPKLLKGVSSKNSLVFGPWSPPRLLALREGRVTPVMYEYGNSMMLWRTLNHGKTPYGGVMVIWPLSLLRFEFPVLFALDQSARSARGSFHPLLIPLQGMSANIRPVLPRSTAAYARSRPVTVSRLIEAAPRLKRGKVGIIEDHLVFREFFSTEKPYDMLAIAPLPRISTPAGGLAVAYRGLFICFWGLIFGYVALSGSPPPVSLRTMFRTLFALVAALPLGTLVMFGYLQISTETQRAIDSVEISAIDTLNSLDLLSRQSLDKFARAAQTSFSSPVFVRNLVGDSSTAGSVTPPDGVALAASETFRIFRDAGEILDDIMVFVPGKSGRIFTADGKENRSAENLDFFAGIITMTHNTLISRFGRFGGSEIMLDTESQKSWCTIFESFGMLAVNTLFYNLMENGQMTSVGSEDIGLHLSQIFFSGGMPRAYVLLNSSTRRPQKEFLLREISRLNLRHPAQHACGDVTPGGTTPYLPAQNSGYWNTIPGRLLHDCLSKSALSDTPITIRRGSLLAVAAPCRTLGPMTTGSIRSIDGILATDSRNKFFLALFALALAATAVFLGRITADHLVTPLETVERTLKTVSGGDLSVRTGLERPDELGRMTGSFDAMIDGLRERRELGKFVSGAIESALGRADIRESHAVSGRGTVLVSDIRAFTSMSESHPPAEIVDLLNTHMEAMTAAIIRHGGRVDRFIGDAVVAVFFGTERESGALSALDAALEMNAASELINTGRRESGAFTYDIGIGVATGELMTGTLDGGRRLDFIVIGEPRSRAEALENLSKLGRHTRIVADLATAARTSNTFNFEEFPHESAAELVSRKAARV